MHDVSSFDYFVYTPFFHFLSAGIIKLFGLSILIPRLISFISFLIVIVTFYFFFSNKKETTENFFVTMILFGLSVSITLYSGYYILARSDLTSYAFAFLSLFFVWKIIYQNSQKKLYFFLAGLFTLLSFFTKQSTFFPYIVIGLALFIAPFKKKWLLLIVYLGIATLVTFFLLNWFTQGAFIKSMILSREVYGKYLLSARHFYWLQNTFIEHFASFIVGGIFLIYFSFNNFFIRKKLPTFSFFVMIAVYCNFLIVGGNSGAAYNTLLPLLFAMLLALKELYSLNDSLIIPHVSKVLFIGIVVVQLFLQNTYSFPYTIPSREDRRNQAILVETIKQSPSQWVLGDRVDYAILLAKKDSSLEASTHNVAREWKNTKAYTDYVEYTLGKRIQDHTISMVVTGITKFGSGPLYQEATTSGILTQTVVITYMDAANLKHNVYLLK